MFEELAEKLKTILIKYYNQNLFRDDLLREVMNYLKEDNYYFAVLQEKGQAVDWVDVDYYGLFESKEEFEEWCEKEENKIQSYRERYVLRRLKNKNS